MRAAASALVLGCAVGGCVLVTGSTDGYEPLPTPPRAADGGGGSLVLGCLSTSDCTDADAGARVCCVVLASASAGASVCQPGPCGGTVPVQLCRDDGECNGAGCREQRCTLGGSAVTVRACGAVPSCTPT